MRSAVLVLLLAAPALARAAGLEAVASFGSNPGGLSMWKYVPADMPRDAPLVVLLHGCTQDARAFQATGFERIADAHKVYLVYAEQPAANNPVRCFNWAGEYGDPANLRRGQGENQSIKEMVDRMKQDHSIDARRVYVAGFSAGGAFSAVMLATWPDVFAAGAILSGVPYGCATTVQAAYDCMALGSHPERKKPAAEWGALVREAFPGYTGPRPRVILFQGSNDLTVQPENLPELVAQWTDVHGLGATPTATAEVGGHERARFERGGEALVETWRMAGMSHAVPVAPPCGSVGAFIEDRGVCAAAEIARFFGLDKAVAGAAGSTGSGGSPTAPGGAAGAGGGAMPPGLDEDDPQRKQMDPIACAGAPGRAPAAPVLPLLLAAALLRRRRR